jgi:hypothetical protein
MNEHEIRADEVKPGDILAGLGRVQAYTHHRGRVTLHSEWGLWRVSVHPLHRVVVLRPPVPAHAHSEKGSK